jgi:hypothetical protein
MFIYTMRVLVQFELLIDPTLDALFDPTALDLDTLITGNGDYIRNLTNDVDIIRNHQCR